MRYDWQRLKPGYRRGRSDMGSKTKDAIGSFSLINRGNIVGKTPIQHSQNNNGPQLRDYIKRGKDPVSNQSDKPLEAGRKNTS